MKSNWEEASIEEIKDPSAYSIAMGPFGSNIKTDNFVSSGVPVIRGGNLKANRFMDDEFVFLTEAKADELKSANAFPNDLVFTHRGTLGQVGIIPQNAKYKRYVVSQSQMKLRCDPQKAAPLFVFYFFKSPQGQNALLANTSTTGVPAISSPLTSLRNIRIPLPPIPEQRAIAGILGALDDKIELNRRMNRTLEAMARTVFRQWFVETEEVGRLDDLLVLQRGFDLPTPQRIPGKYPVVAASGPSGTHNEYKVRGPGVTTGRSGVIGKVYFVHEDFWPLNTSLWIKEFKLAKPAFAYYLLRTLDFAMFNAGSAVPTLNRNHVHNLPLSIPPSELIERFENFAMPLLDTIYANEKQSRTLASLRDTLLPKLMRGDVRVSELQQFCF